MSELAKELGLLEALTIGVGTMIGAGIFVLPGPAAEMAGPAVALSFILAGVIALFTAITASELGTAMPQAGGTYYYINHALGPVIGCVAGIGNWMGLAFASAFYIIGFGSYVTVFFDIPDLQLIFLTLNGKQISGLLAGVLFIGINYIGAKETGRLQNVIVIALVAILILFTGASIPEADWSTLKPLAPKGYGAVFPATALVFVSFLGFAKITTVAEEIENPGENLPKAVIGSVLIVTVIYAAIIVLVTSVTPWDELAGQGDIAVVEVARVAMGSIGAVLLTVAGLLATASSANASILASSRINFAMGRDRLVSNWLNKIHSEYATPNRAIIVTGALIVAFILIGDIKTLAKAGSVLHLLVYGLVNIALIVMREADPPGYDPDYRIPLYPLIPILGALTSFGLIAFMAPVEIIMSAVFVGGSVLWYLIYARNHATAQGVFVDYLLKRADSMPDRAVEAVKAVQPTGSTFRVMVPLANPEHEKDLITIASALARPHDGTVVAVHIVDVPYQTPLSAGAEHLDEIDAGSKLLLRNARSDAETLGVDVEVHTVLSHRVFSEIFDQARVQNADTVVLGWGSDSHGSPGRVESLTGEITGTIPCDFVVFKDNGFDPSRILVPTRGNPGSSDVVSEVAAVMQSEYGSEITVLNVVDGADAAQEAEKKMREWMTEHDLDDVELIIDTSGDVPGTVHRLAAEHTLVILGATEEGLLSRLTRGSQVLEIVEGLDTSVMLAERPQKRPLLKRLFG